MAKMSRRRRDEEIAILLKGINIRATAIMHVLENFEQDLGKPQEVRSFLQWIQSILTDVLSLTEKLKDTIEHT